VVILKLCAVSLEENRSQSRREAGNDLFFISANSTGLNDREQLDARSKKEAFVQQYLCSGEKVLCFV
jgi:hypothetical protein